VSAADRCVDGGEPEWTITPEPSTREQVVRCPVAGGYVPTVGVGTSYYRLGVGVATASTSWVIKYPPVSHPPTPPPGPTASANTLYAVV
jgi:hypothetical protein